MGAACVAGGAQEEGSEAVVGVARGDPAAAEQSLQSNKVTEKNMKRKEGASPTPKGNTAMSLETKKIVN